MSCYNRTRQAEKQSKWLGFFDIIWDESNLISILHVFFHSGCVSFSGDIVPRGVGKSIFSCPICLYFGRGNCWGISCWMVQCQDLCRSFEEDLRADRRHYDWVTRCSIRPSPSAAIFFCLLLFVFYVLQSGLCSIFLKRTSSGDSPFSTLEYLGHWHVAVVSVIRPQYTCMANHLLCSLFSFFFLSD